jgi:hypothetical protein
MPNPYIELFMKKWRGEITQEEFDSEIQRLKDSGADPKIEATKEDNIMDMEDIDWTKTEDDNS